MYPSQHDATECREQPHDGIYIDVPEGTLLWSLFRIPPDCPYISHAISLYQHFHHYCCVFEPEVNVYYQRQREQLALQLEALLPDELDECSSLPQDRRQLHAYLTHYPLFCSLLLIGNEDEMMQVFWLCLLVRIFRALGPDVYEAYLLFDKLRAAYPADVPFIDVGVLTHGSQHGLIQALNTHSFLAPLTPYVKNRIKRTRQFPYQGVNIHTATVVDNEDLTVTLNTACDKEGNEGESWITLTANQVLNDKAAKRKFSNQGRGIVRAIGRANKALPASQTVLTPSECRVFLTLTCPPLLEGKWLSITKAERKYWLLFWLNLLGHSSCDTPLHNRRSTTGNEPSPPYFSYEFDTREGCNVVLQLPADLVKGKQPEVGDKRYYTHQPSFSLSLPWPLQSLFNLVLRDVPSHQRHGTSLTKTLSISSEQYRKWLSMHIRAVKPLVPFHLTISALHRTFLHFSHGQVPDSTLGQLISQGCMQSYYINQEATASNQQIRRYWQVFLDEIGATKAFDSSRETHTSERLGMGSFHDQVGSALTLREELLPLILSAILMPLQHRPSSYLQLPSNHRQMWSERLTLYLHLRAAMTLALRPVEHPYPTLDHIAFQTGLLTVQDKRSHHHDERRVLVADPKLLQLLSQYQCWQQRLLPLSQSRALVGLNVFDGEQWQPLDQNIVKRLLNTYVGELDLGGLRHISASLWLKANQSHFAQTDLNVLMNHFQRGQSPIGLFSLLSLNQLAYHQQLRLKRVVARFEEYDEQAEAALDWLLGGRDA
ncbi:hypothetical protein C9J48_17760 [Photobacterium profundum]|uniref:Uncharacterized protein n=1 Tax=Photobacterium profundum 3TCK TaxID=314280 RepID=Q1Z859_9GAMM|nr:hypothetical protein [Photobacterium profundum]EAS44654.1 hypothetical protein P3TCK_26812 [Photobacterium profundum 3TCK]PSV60646.1 hypothetical protein C9J48_17760 [Photobacterium profundum]